MKTSSLLSLLSLFNSKSQAMDFISPFYPTRMIEPQIINCNTAFIYAETPKPLPSLEEYKIPFQQQTQYLHKLLLSPSFQTELMKHKGIVRFKEQNTFLSNLEKYQSLFMGQNERLIKAIIDNPSLDIPHFDLDFLAMETMLNSLMIVMIFDISHQNPQSKFFFRQGYRAEFIMHDAQKYNVENIPVMAIEDKIIGSPFLEKHTLPISKDTKKVLISIFQIGPKTFFEQKDFNSVTNQLIKQAETRCKLNISKVMFFKGLPIIDSDECSHDGIKLFVQTNRPKHPNRP